MNIFVYSRVSRDKSGIGGVSIPKQISSAKEYASTVIPQIGWSPQTNTDIPGVFVDEGVSAWKYPFAKRKGGRDLLNHIKEGDHLICYAIDRLARNLRDFCNVTAYFEENGVHVHYIADQINTATAIGKLQLHTKAAMAQFTSDLISERVREAKQIKRMREGSPAPIQRTKRAWAQSIYSVPSKTKDEGRVGGTIRLYQRCSTDRQYMSALGLEAQEAGVKRYAERLKESLPGSVINYDMYTDGAISAFKIPFFDRPSGKRLLEESERGDDIVVYRLDRLWRCPGDALKTKEVLEEKGVHLHFVTEGLRTDVQDGLEWLGMLASIAHMESAFKSRRIRDALDQCREQGRPVGPINKGFRAAEHNGKVRMAFDKKEADKLARVWVMKHEEGWSMRQINEAMTCFECVDKGKRATLAHHKNNRPEEKLAQVERLRERISGDLWEECLGRARSFIRGPIPKDKWLFPRWDYPYGYIC